MQTQPYKSFFLDTRDSDELINELIEEVENWIKKLELTPKEFTFQPARLKKFVA